MTSRAARSLSPRHARRVRPGARAAIPQTRPGPARPSHLGRVVGIRTLDPRTSEPIPSEAPRALGAPIMAGFVAGVLDPDRWAFWPKELSRVIGDQVDEAGDVMAAGRTAW